MTQLRTKLIEAVLNWQAAYGVAPSVTSAISELDAALLVGATEESYGLGRRTATAVQRQIDFIHNGVAYQVKANRPSGKAGSTVTLVAKAKRDSRTGSFGWAKLIWILYDQHYNIVEAWLWDQSDYAHEIEPLKYSRPDHMRRGLKLA